MNHHSPEVQKSIDFVKHFLSLKEDERSLLFYESMTMDSQDNSFSKLADIPITKNRQIIREVPVSFLLMNFVDKKLLDSRYLRNTEATYRSVCKRQDSQGYTVQMYLRYATYIYQDEFGNLEIENQKALDNNEVSITEARKQIFEDVEHFFKNNDINPSHDENIGPDSVRSLFPPFEVYYQTFLSDAQSAFFKNENKFYNQTQRFNQYLIGNTEENQENVANILLNLPSIKNYFKDFKEDERYIAYQATQQKETRKSKSKEKKIFKRKYTRLAYGFNDKTLIEQLLSISQAKIKSTKLADILFLINIREYIDHNLRTGEIKRNFILQSLSNLSGETSFYQKSSRTRRLHKLIDRSLKSHEHGGKLTKELKNVLILENKKQQLLNIKQKVVVDEVQEVTKTEVKKSRKTLSM